jgi:hypothetical protein
VNCVVEMGSCSVICVPSFFKIDSGIQQLIGRKHVYIHTFLFIFSKL